MSNANLIRLNKLLKAIMWLSGTIAGLKAAGQVPAWADKFLPFVSLLGAAAAYLAKTPSQAIAAAVPSGKTPAPPAIALLVALGCLLSACGGTSDVGEAEAALLAYVSTGDHNVTLSRPIIYFAEAYVLPPNPHAPSATSHFYHQFGVTAAGVNSASRVYFSAVNSSNFVATPAPGHFERGYTIEVSASRATGALQEGLIKFPAFPGDRIMCDYTGYVPNPYLECVNNNASGKGASAADFDVLWTSDFPFVVEQTPFVHYQLDTADSSGSGFPPAIIHHNCVGDLPAATPAVDLNFNDSRTLYSFDLMTDDFVHHTVRVDPPVPNNAPQISPTNCNLRVTDGVDQYGNPGSNVITYGFQQ